MGTTGSVAGAADSESRAMIEKALNAPQNIAAAKAAAEKSRADEQLAVLKRFLEITSLDGAQALTQFKAYQEIKTRIDEHVSALNAWEEIVKAHLGKLKEDGSPAFQELLKAKIEKLKLDIASHDSQEKELDRIRREYEGWLPAPVARLKV